MDIFLNRIITLLSLGHHPVEIRDIATLTYSSEDQVYAAILELREKGIDVQSDGEAAWIVG